MSYFLRLACICLASFFLVHVIAGMAVLAVSSLAARVAERMRPAAGARMLFVLRLFPLSVALLTVFAFCVPSYLRFEQDSSESIGSVCLFLSLVGLVLIAAPAIRLASLLIRAQPGQSAHPDQSKAGPLVALVGFLRPRLVVSNRVRQALTPSQMEAALLHEEAHRQAYDNLKRLAIVASPGVLPLHPSFRTLERHWARMAEWAADDAAVASEPMRAIDLAEALVRVARLSTGVQTSPLVCSLVARKDDLGERVQRLLLPYPAADLRSPRSTQTRTLSISSAIVAGAALILLPHQENVLYGVHRVMEFLVH